jgi:hypothetical protein
VRVKLRVDLARLLGGADRQQVTRHGVLGIGRLVRPAVERLPHQQPRPQLPPGRHREVDVAKEPVDQRLVGNAAHEVLEVLRAQALADGVIQAALAAEVVIQRPGADVRPAHDPLHPRAGEPVFRELTHRGVQYPFRCRVRRAPMQVHLPMIGGTAGERAPLWALI